MGCLHTPCILRVGFGVFHSFSLEVKRVSRVAGDNIQKMFSMMFLRCDHLNYK